MSIYPVDFKNDLHWKEELEKLSFITKSNTVIPCIVCGADVRKSNQLWMYHAAPWGYAVEDVWCSEKCLERGAE